MKNQFFGDEKDYLTYGLLRAIARSSGLRIGVAWMLTPDQANGDGELRTYLTPTQRLLWEHHDPELYQQLARVAEVGRSVDLAQAWNLIPGASYDPTVIPTDGRARAAVFRRLFERLHDCEILFFDPDNGLETPAIVHGARRSPQHLYWDEVKEAYTRQQHSLLIFQHFPRRGRAEYLAERAQELTRHLGIARVDWFQTAQVAFFLAARPEHAAALEKAPVEVQAHWRGRITHGIFPGPGDQAETPGSNLQGMAPGPEPGVETQETASPGKAAQSGYTLHLLPGRYAVYRFPPDAALPGWADGELVSITRTPDELSVVCAEHDSNPGAAAGMRVEAGWRVLRVAGPLDFSLTGVLSALSTPLAQAGIPIFAISTYDTDIIMVKEPTLEAAVRALRAAGNRVEWNE